METPDQTPSEKPPVPYRGARADPTFGYLIGVAVALGLTALPADNTDLRYTLSWLVLAAFGVLAWLTGTVEHIDREKPENLAWGVIFGLIIGLPLLAFASTLLGDTVKLLFPGMKLGTILAYIVFVMPLAETLFLRNILQQNRPWWIAGLWSSLWSIILFFPVMWADVLASPVVALVLATILAMVNLIYSYVRQRNGLAAAWICQIVINILIVFLPSL